MRRKVLLFGLGLVAVAGATLSWMWHRSYVVELDQPFLQQWLDGRFPLERRPLGLARVTVSEPRVTLVEGSDRIRFATRAAVGLERHPALLHGTVELSARLRYDPSQGALYADDPRVESLAIAGLPAAYVGATSQATTWALQQVLGARPVYVLRPVGFRRSLARLVLADARVVDGKLRVVLGGG